MNLPLVVDIAIGIIFIYLTLSLLASEIQELIATVLQWRAEHLKESIQVLLQGGGKTPSQRSVEQKAQEVQFLTDRLYSHPLINTLNQEAKGKFAQLNRKLSNQVVNTFYRLASWVYRLISKALGKKDGSLQNPFENHSSAPSYIPSDIFASTILETFQFSKIGRIFTISRLEKFQKRQVSAILKQIRYLSDRDSRRMATERLQQMTREWNRMRENFAEGGGTLPAVLDRMENSLNGYIGYCQEFLNEPENVKKFFLYELQFLRDRYYSPTEKPAILTALKPNLNELMELARNKPRVYQELENAVRDRDSPAYQGFKKAIDALPDLPEPVQNSLTALVERAQIKKDSIEEELQDLHREIEQWFDNSMTRASGVYRRNARGIAIAIGFIVAVAANADTLFIVDSLSQNSLLRGTISDYAQTELQRTPDIDSVKQTVRQQLTDVSLPIGWESDIRTRQIPVAQPLSVPNTGVSLPNPIFYLKRLAGWLITGVAISMGAAFWYDLLKKIITVKNTGGKE